MHNLSNFGSAYVVWKKKKKKVTLLDNLTSQSIYSQIPNTKSLLEN